MRVPLRHLPLKATAIALRVAGLPFRRKAKLDASTIRSILINRADRLGDAVVTLPFLFALQGEFELTVLTSGENDAFLSKFFSTHKIKDKADNMRDTGRALLRRAGPLEHATTEPQFDLYLDLQGVRGARILAEVRRLGLCRFHAGFDMGPWNGELDCVLPCFPVLFNDAPLVELQSRLLEAACGLALTAPDTIDLAPVEVEPGQVLLPEHRFLLVNVAGRDRFRGPEATFFIDMIRRIAARCAVIAMDEIGRPNELATAALRGVPNVQVIDKDLSTEELIFIARRASLYVGADCGISQLLASQCSSLMLFGNGCPATWKPRVAAGYASSRFGDLTVERARNDHGMLRCVIYRNVWCRPCFDYGCADAQCISSFDVEHCVNIALDMLQSATQPAGRPKCTLAHRLRK